MSLYICNVMTNTSVKVLIRLMEDPDEHVYAHVREQLSSIGKTAIPMLENSWEQEDYGLLFQKRVEDLIKDIQFDEVKMALAEWIRSDEKDLLKGALIIARYQYPNLDEEKICSFVREIRDAIWLELSPFSTAYEKVKIINKILFERFRFHGNKNNYHSPLNSYINTVFELKTGNPLSLSIVYSVIAEQLKIPVYGVNLPNHFILAYMDELNVNPLIGNENIYGVLFYVDAFNAGRILREQEIREFVGQMKLQPVRGYFEPCSNSGILQRMLTNLAFAYKQLGKMEKVQELQELEKMFR